MSVVRGSGHTVHHLNNSRSFRIIWLLEELEVEYHIKYYQRDPKTLRAPPELNTIHPLGSAPVITDNNLILAESGAIMEYLLYKYGEKNLKPSIGTTQWIQYTYWLHFAEGSLMPILFLKLVFENVLYHLPFFLKPIFKAIKNKVNHKFINRRLVLQLSYIESALEKNLWFSGEDFSAADIQMAIPLLWAVSNDFNIQTPKINAFLDKIKARRAFVRALEKGGDIERIKIK